MIETLSAPVTYLPNFVPNPDKAFATLRDELEWERRDDAPRSEYYCNDVDQPYEYGRGKGRRLYERRPYHPIILDIRRDLEALTGSKFEVCFLNQYMDQSDQLGWHADDSPEMDDLRPIASVSLGVAREIWFRKLPERMSAVPVIQKQLLGHGSLCLMAPGMQETWQHRIPKASFQCGERVSLTFRGYLSTAEGTS